MSTVTSVPQPGSSPARPVSPSVTGAGLPDTIKSLLAALGGVAVAVITLLTSFSVVSWSAAETGLATAEAAAAIGFLSACVAHFWPGTQKEPVAVAGTFTALVAATLALLSGFHVWTLTQDETSALLGLVTAVLAVGAALFARGKVTAG